MASSPTRVLMVADDSAVRDVPHSLPGDLSVNCAEAADCEQAKKALKREQFDVLVVDVSRPDADCMELLQYTRNTSPDCRIVLVSGNLVHREIARGFAMGATGYLQKPFEAKDLLAAISDVMATDSWREEPPLPGMAGLHISERKRASLEGIRALVSAVEAKDPYTQQHSRQVTHYATHLARRLNLPDDMVESVFVASMVHDVGKIGVPDSILTKPDILTEQEFQRIRRHPALGEAIIRNLSAFDVEARIIRHHHENWDGSGYPDGLTGEEIPLGSRIIRIADAMDAMLMARSYDGPYPVETMLDELTRCAGRCFDPKLAAIAAEWARMHTRELVLVSPGTEPARSQSA